MIVRTSYGTGPYVIKEIYGPCACPKYLDVINKRLAPSKPHYRLTLRSLNPRDRGDYYLNGYDKNGNSVWCSDRLIFCDDESTMLTLVACM